MQLTLVCGATHLPWSVKQRLKAINSRSALVGPLARSLARNLAGASSRSAVRMKANESLAKPAMKPDYNR